MARDIFARKKIIFGNDVFYVQQYPPFEGIRVLGELQKVILPAIGGAAIGFSEHGFGEGIAGSLLNISDNLDADKVETLSRMLLNPKYVAVDIGGTGDRNKFKQLDEDTIAEIFTGRYIDMIILMIKIAKENFADFTQLCGIPTGVARGIENVIAQFQESLTQSLNGNFSSTEQSTQE